MDNTNERKIEFDPSVAAWRFEVEIALDGNTQTTFVGYRLTREAAREAVKQICLLGVRKLYLDAQQTRQW